MGRQSKTLVVEDLEFICQQSPWERASLLATRAIDLFKVSHDNMAATIAMALVVFQHDPGLLADLLFGTQVIYTNEAGQRVTESLANADARNRALSGRLVAGYRAAIFAAEVEFGDFFGAGFVASGDGPATPSAPEASPA